MASESDASSNHSSEGEDGPSDPSSSLAPFRTYPKQPYASIEYPGPISHPSAILKVVSQADINECFNVTKNDRNNNEDTTLEMRYKEFDPYAVPVKGNRVPSQKLLMKIVKRKRRNVDSNGHTGHGEGSRKGKGKQREGTENGVFTAEIVGPVTQTVRFRSMADFHYTPNLEGRTAQIVGALRDLDYDTILDYSVPPLDENFTEPMTPSLGEESHGELSRQEYRSLLDLQPLPIFSDRRLPLIYNYKNHGASVIEEVEDRLTGEVKQRYINKSRHVAASVPVIGHGAQLGEVPTQPPKSMQEKLSRANPRLMNRLKELLEERPVWLRHNLLRQFNDADRHTIVTQKNYLPALVYTFGAGPYWKCLCKLGYDPRTDPESRKFQRIYFYLNVNRIGLRGPGYQSPEPDEADQEEGNATSGPKAHRRTEWEKEQEQRAAEGKRPPLDREHDYIFDGKVLNRDNPDYQLCDIIDPIIRRYIDDPEAVADTCNSIHGWYKPAVLNLIKSLTRIKFSHMRETNEPATDALCFSALEDYERGKLENNDQFNEENEDNEDGDEIGSGDADSENVDMDD